MKLNSNPPRPEIKRDMSQGEPKINLFEKQPT